MHTRALVPGVRALFLAGRCAVQAFQPFPQTIDSFTFENPPSQLLRFSLFCDLFAPSFPQGDALFKPGPALQMFPLYLLAAQANLGLR